MKSLTEAVNAIISNQLNNQLNEGVPLGPMRYGLKVFGDRDPNAPGAFAMRDSASKHRSERLKSLQLTGEKKATDVIYKLHDKIPGLYDAHLGTQLSGNYGALGDPTGAIQDADRYIKIAKMIADHPSGGHQHAHDYLHGSSMYQLGLATEYGSDYSDGDPYMKYQKFSTNPNTGEETPYGYNPRLAGANIERKVTDDFRDMAMPTPRGKAAGDQALRMMSAARKRKSF